MGANSSSTGHWPKGISTVFNLSSGQCYHPSKNRLSARQNRGGSFQKKIGHCVLLLPQRARLLPLRQLPPASAFPNLPYRGQFNRLMRRHYEAIVAFFSRLVARLHSQDCPYEALDGPGVLAEMPSVEALVGYLSSFCFHLSTSVVV